jgi:cytochrome c oxidase subunit 1
MHSISPSDAQQQDTYFIVAHIHYVLFGGAILGLFAGVYYWFPKFTGRLLNETSGKIHFWVTMIGFNVAFFPMHLVGLNGMPRRQSTYAADMGWGLWNFVETIGVMIIIVATLVFLHNFFRSLRKGEAAGQDPWDARTLEWSIQSPPPEHNFDVIPHVRARDDYWERKHPHAPQVPAGAAGHGAPARTEEEIHMPQPSYWPALVAVGFLVAGYGLIYAINRAPGAWSISWGGFIALVVGIAITVVTLAGWYMQPASKQDHH